MTVAGEVTFMFPDQSSFLGAYVRIRVQYIIVQWDVTDTTETV